ncbi:hypothetical protein D3C83_266210 [compost metagenome]
MRQHARSRGQRVEAESACGAREILGDAAGLSPFLGARCFDEVLGELFCRGNIGLENVHKGLEAE